MRFNSTKPENLTGISCSMKDRLTTFPDAQGASAWPTKAGPVRAPVNSDNSARSWPLVARFLFRKGSHSDGTAVIKTEEGRADVKSVRCFNAGLHASYNCLNRDSAPPRGEAKI